MKTTKELISTIDLNDENLSHILKFKKINGTLFVEIERIMKEYADQEAKAYAKWLTDQVISGRTFDKLWNDYKNGK